jgi:hypothetical protein
VPNVRICPTREPRRISDATLAEEIARLRRSLALGRQVHEHCAMAGMPWIMSNHRKSLVARERRLARLLRQRCVRSN